MPAEDPIRDRVTRSVRDIDADINTALSQVSRRGRRRRRLAFAIESSIVVGLVALVVIAGPGFIDFIRTTPNRPAVASPTVPDSVIAGTYRATIAPAPGVVTRARMAGRWILGLNADGSIDLVAPPGLEAETSGVTYRLDGHEFQTNAFPNDLCPSQPGTYRWSKASGRLRFALVSDPCEARVVLFTSQDWNEE